MSMISLSSFFKPASLIAALSITAVACSDGPGNAADLQEILELSEQVDTSQAECIASATFDKYGADEEAWKAISEADDLESLTVGDAKEKVVGFKDFFDGTISDCLSSRPQ